MAMTSKEMKESVPGALREARQRAGLSAETVASRAKISAQAVSKHEEGYNLPHLEVFIMELAALGLDFGSLHEILLEERLNTRMRDLESKFCQLEGKVSASRST